MLKPSLQLKLGQQLTMTPQLQQAIRLLQLPALELQAHIRELLEKNVMLEAVEETEGTGTFEVTTSAEPPRPAESRRESTVEVLDEPWSQQNTGPADTPWSGDDDERQQDYADDEGQSLQDHLLWQLELARLGPRALASAVAIVEAAGEGGAPSRWPPRSWTRSARPAISPSRSRRLPRRCAPRSRPRPRKCRPSSSG